MKSILLIYNEFNCCWEGEFDSDPDSDLAMETPSCVLMRAQIRNHPWFPLSANPDISVCRGKPRDSSGRVNKTHPGTGRSTRYHLEGRSEATMRVEVLQEKAPNGGQGAPRP